MVADADDGRRSVAAEECARFGSGRDKWRASWESRENMICIRADEVSNSDGQAREYSSPQENFLEQIGRTCLSLRCANKLWHGDAAPGVLRRSIPFGDVTFRSERLQGRGRLSSGLGRRETGGPVTTRGGAADGSYGVGRERSINAGHHSADLGTTTLLARTESVNNLIPVHLFRTRRGTAIYLYTRFKGH